MDIFWKYSIHVVVAYIMVGFTNLIFGKNFELTNWQATFVLLYVILWEVTDILNFLEKKGPYKDKD